MGSFKFVNFSTIKGKPYYIQFYITNKFLLSKDDIIFKLFS